SSIERSMRGEPTVPGLLAPGRIPERKTNIRARARVQVGGIRGGAKGVWIDLKIRSTLALLVALALMTWVVVGCGQRAETGGGTETPAATSEPPPATGGESPTGEPPAGAEAPPAEVPP